MTKKRSRPDHARARATRDERVDRIVGLMCAGKWKGAKSARDLSQQWGVGMNTVHDYAREASGIVRRVIEGDPGEIRAQIVAGVDAVRDTALKLVRYQRTGPETYEALPAPNCDAALRAFELRAKLLGVMVEKHEVTVDDKRPGTPAEELAELDTLIAELTARRDELRAEMGGTIQ